MTRLSCWSARAAGVVLAWAGLTAPLGLDAQTPSAGSPGVERTWTSPLLPEGHWSIQSLWKAEALGLLEGFLPAQRDVPRYVAGAELMRARRNARSYPELEALTGDWYARFLQEFPDFDARVDGRAGSGVELLGSALSVGYEHWRGRVAPGTAQFPPDRTGPLPLPPLDHPLASATIALSAGRHIAAELGPQLHAGDLGLRLFDVTAGWRGWSLSLGRRPISYAGVSGEGIVLSGGVPLDRVQLETRVPIRFARVLRPLGSSSLHGFVGRLPGERHPGRPFFWGGRAALQPHHRFTVSVQRAGMFGGDGTDVPVTARNLLQMLVGSVAGGGFEDQIVSVSGRYRLPSEPVLPLTIYLEWGAEDGAGAWWDVPGRVAGVLAPRLPLAPEVSVGAEYAHFGRSCCGNPPWYRHWAFPGGWAGTERPLGHRLGGQGSEVRLLSRADLAGSRIRLEADAFRRERDEDNLYVPGREGQSRGFRVAADWRFTPAAEISAMLAQESGQGWMERRLEVGGMIFVRANR